jgi:hypothetical protein
VFVPLRRLFGGRARHRLMNLVLSFLMILMNNLEIKSDFLRLSEMKQEALEVSPLH